MRAWVLLTLTLVAIALGAWKLGKIENRLTELTGAVAEIRLWCGHLDRRLSTRSVDRPVPKPERPVCERPTLLPPVDLASSEKPSGEDGHESAVQIGVGRMLRFSELSNGERRFIEEYKERAAGTGLEISDHALFVRGLDRSLGAVTIVDTVTSEELPLDEENASWMAEISELTARAKLVEDLVVERMIHDAVVHETRDAALEYAHEELKLEHGFTIREARDGFVVIEPGKRWSAPELASLRARLGALTSQSGVRADARWLTP